MLTNTWNLKLLHRMYSYPVRISWKSIWPDPSSSIKLKIYLMPSSNSWKTLNHNRAQFMTQHNKLDAARHTSVLQSLALCSFNTIQYQQSVQTGWGLADANNLNVRERAQKDTFFYKRCGRANVQRQTSSSRPISRAVSGSKGAASEASSFFFDEEASCR